jgi:hypothetical protein
MQTKRGDEVQLEDFDAEDYDQMEQTSESMNDFQKLQQALGAKSATPDELASKFIQQEEVNFGLFTTVSQLKKQVENTETEIYDLQG